MLLCREQAEVDRIVAAAAAPILSLTPASSQVWSAVDFVKQRVVLYPRRSGEVETVARRSAEEYEQPVHVEASEQTAASAAAAVLVWQHHD